MPGEFLVSLSHNLLDVTTEDIKQFVAIQASKQMSVFQKVVAIESDGDTLENSDEWAIFEDSDGLDSDDKESNDSSFEFDEHGGEMAEYNVPRFEIQSNSNLCVAERNKTDNDEIAIEQGKISGNICG